MSKSTRDMLAILADATPAEQQKLDCPRSSSSDGMVVKSKHQPTPSFADVLKMCLNPEENLDNKPKG